MNKTFNLDLKALKSCAPLMCADEARHYLCGVHLYEKDGALVYEATNGHALVRVTSELQYDDMSFDELDIIIPSFLVSYLCKPAFTKGFGIEGDFFPCHVDATRINIEMLNGVINYKLIDGEYPALDGVIPKTSAVTFNKININAKYVDYLAKSITVFSGTPVIKFQFTGDRYGSPILIQSEQEKNWIGVLMPATMFDAE